MGDWSIVALKMLYHFIRFIVSPLNVSACSFGTGFWNKTDFELVEQWFEFSAFRCPDGRSYHLMSYNLFQGKYSEEWAN